jgi:hypothetical protein
LPEGSIRRRRAASDSSKTCSDGITQLLGFGIEKHDDAVDALVYLILGLVGEGIALQEVHYV